MLTDEINELKELLNKQVENSSLVSERILTISQDLDKLILEYYKNQIKSHLTTTKP